MKYSILAALSLVLSGPVLAYGTAIDQQVDEFFTQGIKHCKNAMALSRTSREVAAAEFDRYSSYMSKVEALKPELKTDIMIKRQMEQCDQVGHDIARNKALPIFEQGLFACKEVKTLIRRDHLTKAKAKFLEYMQYRDEALSMTDTVLKIGSNASKVRRCDRLEEKIIAAEQRIHYSEIKADRLLSTLRKSNDSCQVTNRMLENTGTNLEKLKAAESMLNQAREYFSQTQNYPEAVARAENFPGYESSKKIRQSMLEYSRCEQNAVAALEERKQVIAQLNQQQKAEQVAQVDASNMEVADVPGSDAPIIESNQAPGPQGDYTQGLVQVDHGIE